MIGQLKKGCPQNINPLLYLPLISIQLLHNSIGKAVAYLERRLPYLTNPYAAAMTSYALANENKLDRGILFKFASPGFFMQHP